MMIDTRHTITMAYNALTSTNQALERTARALSTGLKAAVSADDASGVAIGTSKSAQAAGVDRAIRNSQDGISLLQTAEGGLNQINSMLQRMRELSMQAANDTLTTQDRSYLQLEIAELRKNIDNVASNTTFNSKRLLDGSSSAIWSSNDATTKLKVTGALTEIDPFGQRKPIEGNFRIEVKAKAGQAEVQKTNIFSLTVAEEYMETETVRVPLTPSTSPTPEVKPKVPAKPNEEINIETGVSSSGATSGDGWSFSGGVLSITGDGKYSIVGTNSVTTNRVEVKEGVKATVFLNDVNIDVSATSYTSAFDIRGASVDMYLSGTNTLKSGYDASGLQVQDVLSTGSKGSLTINSASGYGSEEGTLNASCESGCAAGIGGACYTSRDMSPSGWCGSVGGITITGGTINATAKGPGAGIGGGGYSSSYLNRPGSHVNVTINGGDVTAKSNGSGAGIGSGAGSRTTEYSNVDQIVISGGTVNAQGTGGGAAIGGGTGSNSGKILITDKAKANLTVDGWIDTENGNTEPIGRGLNGLFDDNDTEALIKKVRIRETTLAEISQFYDASSRFMLTEPQTITITQGNSRTTSFTLYSSDTISEAAKKINDAIADGLGQAQYTDSREHFCTVADGTKNTSESVRSEADAVYQPKYQRNADGKLELDKFGKPIELDGEGDLVGYTERGTLLIRSAVAGEAGRLKFSAESNDLINALGLNTIQEAAENVFTASVFNAHTGSVIASNMECEGNVLVGALGSNASIEFDPMANVSASWNEKTKSYVLSSEKSAYVTTIHVSDRSTSFQIGQGEGEDIYISIGDMRSASLGLDRVDVLTRESAASSLTLLDAAIHKVGIQRSRVGSYQNELEYNANSLQQTGLHLQESESRITDADMATEYMEFVKFQILNQTGSSMLAQASQNAQSIMNVLAQ
ncbi:MAG: hypothetical protein IJT02_05580 [Synergistaceae bacterium]|nr:hypothetical protein [Synergistaceae bacterium]